MEEESLKNFINSIIFLVKLFAGSKDKFLSQKLYDKIFEFSANYIKLFSLSGEKSEGVSHNMSFISLRNNTDNLLEFLDYLEHSKSVSVSPLLYARRSLLNFKLELIKFHHQLTQPSLRTKEDKPVSFVHRNIKPRKLKDASNKERIFNFIKYSPNSRTKEIIEEFNILSERTVKRNLKELTTEGLIRKLTKDKGVYYSVI